MSGHSHPEAPPKRVLVPLRDLPIRRKLMLVTLLTSSFAVLLMCAVLVAYEVVEFRRGLAANTEVLANVTAFNSTAALAFDSPQDASETLGALAAEPQILSAAIYDAKGELFAQFVPKSEWGRAVPETPGPDGSVFSKSQLSVIRPIEENGKRLGTIYLSANLEPMYARFWFYGELAVAVSAASAIAAVLFSTFLQRRISAPIVELAAVARAVSENEDYSVRAAQYGRDELGELTEAFNRMLARIEGSRAELAASEERLRLALEGSQMGTWDWNLLTGEVLWDDHMYPLFGREKSETKSTRDGHLEAVYPDDREELNRQIQEAIERKIDLNVAFRVLTDGGEIRHMSSRGRAFYDADGTPLRMTGVSMDITLSKQTAEDLRIAKEAAEAANAAKDNFLAILSHELRTPLTAVLATVAMLEEDRGVPAETRDEIRLIRRNVQLEARLIDDLLDVTRIARGKLELNRQLVDARSLLEHAMQSYCAREAAQKKLEVTVESTAENAFVMADTSRLTQVFWNLLQNACKFTPERGAIRVKILNETPPGKKQSDMVIEIADTGIGIEPDVLPRIFDAFEQGEGSRARVFGGLGLGLAISRALVELHGGTLTASSPGKDKGATFTIRLASAAQAAGPSEAAPSPSNGTQPAAKPGGASGLRILLVEDHPDSGKQISRLLHRAGNEVAWAQNLKEAREIAGGQARFDLVVSDLGLPDGSGCELMRELSDRYGVPGVALSGYGTEADVRQSMEAGFTVHLTKPIDWEDLKRAIESIPALEKNAPA